MVEAKPAYTSALDCNRDLARLELIAGFKVLESWFCWSNPQIVRGIGEDTNVWFV
jgi:hypothetical protein